MSDLAVYTVPSITDLFVDDLEEAFKHEKLNLLLSQPPRKEWVKKHPFIDNHYYLPIDKVEFMLRKIFQQSKIEITGQGTAFNAVWVTVRVHYLNPVTGEWCFHDGIGAAQLQTKKGTSATDMININNGAVSMAFPIAKTLAVKDACDHFGNLFGANLNRKDVVAFTPDDKILLAKQKQDEALQDLIDLYQAKQESITDELLKQDAQRVILSKEHKSYEKIRKQLAEL